MHIIYYIFSRVNRKSKKFQVSAVISRYLKKSDFFNVFKTFLCNFGCIELKKFTATETGSSFHEAVFPKIFESLADFAYGIFFAFWRGYNVIETDGFFHFKSVIYGKQNIKCTCVIDTQSVSPHLSQSNCTLHIVHC